MRQREFEGFERRMDKGSKLAGRNKKLHLLTGIEAGLGIEAKPGTFFLLHLPFFWLHLCKVASADGN